MINYNGDLLPASSHFLNHQNRGLQLGDALSEKLRYTGTSILFLETHYFRLMASMRQLRMEIPMDFTMEQVEAEIIKVLRACGSESSPAMVDFTVFRNGGVGLLPDSLEVSYIISIEPLEEPGFSLVDGTFSADLFRDYYVQADGLARVGHNQRVVEVLASIFAEENALDTCLLLNHRKELCQGLGSNLFLRKGDKIRTPALASGCREGILRKVLLHQDWTKRPYDLEEAVISPFELQQADELFLSDIAKGIQPITTYRKARYSNEASLYMVDLLNEVAKPA